MKKIYNPIQTKKRNLQLAINDLLEEQNIKNSLLEKAIEGAFNLEYKENKSLDEVYNIIYKNKECSEEMKDIVYQIKIYLIRFKKYTPDHYNNI